MSGKPVNAHKPSAFKYRPRFAVIVEVPDERRQRILYNRLLKQGLKPRVVCV
jgi:hypothetical protein